MHKHLPKEGMRSRYLGDKFLFFAGILAGVLSIRDGLSLVNGEYAHANTLPFAARVGIPMVLATGALSGRWNHRIGMVALGVCALIQLNISAWQLGLAGTATGLVCAALAAWTGFRRSPAGGA